VVLAGMLPPFAIQSEETRANARHCTVGIEPRISSERIILLDTQVFFSSFHRFPFVYDGFFICLLSLFRLTKLPSAYYLLQNLFTLNLDWLMKIHLELLCSRLP